MRAKRVRILIALMLFIVSVNLTLAQTTTFTYQGKLTDGANPANGNYDMQFKLFDTATVGTGIQQGPTATNPTVAVSAGIFTVQLDFGLAPFSGPPRFLEIGVRPAGSHDPYTLLSPRQAVTSTPYSVRSLNSSVADVLSSACVGCVSSTQIGSVSGSAVTGPIPVASVPAGSGNYVQNTTSPQASSNFNISGDGTVGGTLSASAVNAAAQYNIAGGRVLSVAGTANLFAGYNSGTNNTGSNNSFFGPGAGAQNTTGGSNSYFGTQAGASNASGANNAFFGSRAGFDNLVSDNSFFGYRAGESNTSGDENSFFGSRAGNLNTTGRFNSFFGFHAGAANTIGGSNAFFGDRAGGFNTSGQLNSFFGNFAGMSNTTGVNNSFFGADAGLVNTTGGDNSFFGQFAGSGNTTGNSNSFFGSAAGGSITTGANNSFFGFGAGELTTTSLNNSFFGTQAGHLETTGSNNAFFGYQAGFNNDAGTFNVFVGAFAGNTNTTGNNNTIIGYNADVGSNNLTYATAIGAGAVVTTSHTIVIGTPNEIVEINGPSQFESPIILSGVTGGGTISLCLTSFGVVAQCGSSLRYKTNVQTFTAGLNVVRRLRPIAFNWKEGGSRDVGFGAEEVEKIEPLLTTRNAQGEIEGVKYGQVTTVLVNAVREQQQIIEQQQRRLDALTKLVCSSNPQADVCK